MSCDGEVLDLVSSDIVQVKSEPSASTAGKVCSVCGDLALGCNFNALTCESCKAFFRRNALKAKEFKCPFSENCVMTTVTRRFCQRCRLQKCFAVGMRKEYIMSEEERLNKRNKIEQNRARKRAAAQTTDTKGSSGSKRNCPLSRASASTSEWTQSAAEWHAGNTVDSQSPPQGADTLSEGLLEPFPSPSTASSAASVPSPNSPPDSATVAASHNTEMIAQQENAIPCKQSMISVITYPQHSNSLSCDTRDSHQTSFSVHTQTSPMFHNSTNKVLKDMATQTFEQSMKYTAKQSTPLLSSLISSQRSDEATGTHQEASTSPPPSDSTGGWTGVDGVSSSAATWDSCVPTGMQQDSGINQDILQDVFRIPVLPNSIESILSEAIKLEFSTYTPSTPSMSHMHSQVLPQNRELNDAERAKLNELIVANKALLAPIEESPFVGSQTSTDPRLLDIINLTAVAIQRLVKMAKKINAFKNMCQEDQVALLKGACMEMLILQSATRYNPDKDIWAIPHSTNSRMANISVDVLKEARGNLYQEHRRFQRTFDPTWKADENIMLILSAIALFTPDRPLIVHRDVIKLEQNSYYYLLRRYLESTLPGCEARSAFLKLIQKVSELHRLNEEHVRAYLDVDPSEVEPLLIEIFDLKPQSLS